MILGEGWVGCDVILRMEWNGEGLSGEGGDAGKRNKGLMAMDDGEDAWR